jgi:hypothetical protein
LVVECHSFLEDMAGHVTMSTRIRYVRANESVIP